MYANQIIWTFIPFIFSKTTFSVKILDGSYNVYRMNIFNVYVPVSDEFYNKYFILFYIFDFITVNFYFAFTMTFDIYMIMTCYTFVYQLDTINDSITTLGHNNKI